MGMGKIPPERKQMKKRSIVAVIAAIAIATSAFIWYSYSQKYVQDSAQTATKGILFKTTLNLSEYNNISKGNDIWGRFDSYSRSDRHTEVLRIYCNDYCK